MSRTSCPWLRTAPPMKCAPEQAVLQQVLEQGQTRCSRLQRNVTAALIGLVPLTLTLISRCRECSTRSNGWCDPGQAGLAVSGNLKHAVAHGGGLFAALAL